MRRIDAIGDGLRSDPGLATGVHNRPILRPVHSAPTTRRALLNNVRRVMSATRRGSDSLLCRRRVSSSPCRARHLLAGFRGHWPARKTRRDKRLGACCRHTTTARIANFRACFRRPLDSCEFRPDLVFGGLRMGFQDEILAAIGLVQPILVARRIHRSQNSNFTFSRHVNAPERPPQLSPECVRAESLNQLMNDFR